MAQLSILYSLSFAKKSEKKKKKKKKSDLLEITLRRKTCCSTTSSSIIFLVHPDQLLIFNYANNATPCVERFTHTSIETHSNKRTK